MRKMTTLDSAPRLAGLMLARRRVAKGWSQERVATEATLQLAEPDVVSRWYVQRMESGPPRPLSNLPRLVALCGALGLTLADYLHALGVDCRHMGES